MEKGVSDPRGNAARYCSRSLCSCFASTRLGQNRHLHGYFAPHPSPSSGLAEAHSVDMADRPPFWNGAGRPLFGNDHLRTPLAILFNNQGLVKNEFRAGLALVRVTESSVTAIVYYQLGLFIAESESILLVFIPSVLIGVPLGAYLIRRLDAETFRRICMSFDAWVVGFGLSRVLIELNLMESPWAYSVMAVTMLIDAYLLYIFFTVRRPASMPSQTLRVPQTPDDRQYDRIPLRITEPSRDLFGPLNPMFGLLGYVIAIAAIAMLAYVVSPAIWPLP